MTFGALCPGAMPRACAPQIRRSRIDAAPGANAGEGRQFRYFADDHAIVEDVARREERIIRSRGSRHTAAH